MHIRVDAMATGLKAQSLHFLLPSCLFDFTVTLLLLCLRFMLHRLVRDGLSATPFGRPRKAHDRIVSRTRRDDFGIHRHTTSVYKLDTRPLVDVCRASRLL